MGGAAHDGQLHLPGTYRTGFANLTYHTICIGEVGFFTKHSPLGTVLPYLFNESHWLPEFSIRNPDSTEHQVQLAQQRLDAVAPDRHVFLFVNVPATHPPHHMYSGATEDSVASQAAALAYVDSHIGKLFAAMQRRGPCLVVICADHGTALGEDGPHGHGVPHTVVWTVPHAEFVLPGI
jgi:hypothetical protein